MLYSFAVILYALLLLIHQHSEHIMASLQEKVLNYHIFGFYIGYFCLKKIIHGGCNMKKNNTPAPPMYYENK